LLIVGGTINSRGDNQPLFYFWKSANSRIVWPIRRGQLFQRTTRSGAATRTWIAQTAEKNRWLVYSSSLWREPTILKRP
jgi:hypothetical protein